MKKLPALFSAMTVTAMSLFGMLISKDPQMVNYSPDTGDTTMIIFIILGVVAVGVLIFLSSRRKK